MSERDPAGPKIPIPGAPGAAIYAVLMRLSMICGDASVTITKERLPGGGYAYLTAINVTQRS